MTEDIENKSLVQPANTVEWIDGWEACDMCIHHCRLDGCCELDVGKDELEIKDWDGMLLVVCTKFED